MCSEECQAERTATMGHWVDFRAGSDVQASEHYCIAYVGVNAITLNLDATFWARHNPVATTLLAQA